MYSQREDFFLCNRRRKEEENLSTKIIQIY